MFYFWNKGSKNFQNFFIPNFQIVYIYVFSAPRTLIAIFCLFSCFLLVIWSHTGIGSADWGACTGPFFSVVMFCWVRAHTCNCPRLKKRYSGHSEVAYKVPVWWATAGVGPHQVNHKPFKVLPFGNTNYWTLFQI